MPLVSWIYSEKHKAQLEGEESPIFDHWSGLTCDQPKGVNGKALVELRASMLDCSEAEAVRFGKQFAGTRSIKLRAIEKFRKRRQDSIKVVWFVQNRIQDIASFNVLLRKENESAFLVNDTVGYLKRDFLLSSLPIRQRYVLCIFAIDSTGIVSDDFAHDCVPFHNGQSSIELDAEGAHSSRSSPASVSSSGGARRRPATGHSTIVFSYLLLLLIFISQSIYLF